MMRERVELRRLFLRRLTCEGDIFLNARKSLELQVKPFVTLAEAGQAGGTSNINEHRSSHITWGAFAKP